MISGFRATDYCGALMLPARITFAHFSSSARSCCANASGVQPTGSSPSVASPSQLRGLASRGRHRLGLTAATKPKPRSSASGTRACWLSPHADRPHLTARAWGDRGCVKGHVSALFGYSSVG